MTKSIALSVIIPAYNEAERIGKTLRLADAYLRDRPYTYEILVVDDGSSDGTARYVASLSGTVMNLRLLRHEANRGKGWAVRTGMLQSSGIYRLFMDADGSTSIEQWDLLKSELEAGSDVAVSSRHAIGSSIRVRQAPHRELLGFFFRNLVKWVFGLQINDTQNGFKAFRAEAAERIFRRQKVRGWAFDVELLSIAKSLGYSMTEVPISWVDDDRSRVTFMAMPVMLLDIIRIRINSMRVPLRGSRLPEPRFIQSPLMFKDFPRTQ